MAAFDNWRGGSPLASLPGLSSELAFGLYLRGEPTQTLENAAPNAATVAVATSVVASSAVGVERFAGAATAATVATASSVSGVERFAGAIDVTTADVADGAGTERFRGSGGDAFATTILGSNVTRFLGPAAVRFPVAAEGGTARQRFRGVSTWLVSGPTIAGAGRQLFFAGRTIARVSAVGEITAQVSE